LVQKLRNRKTRRFAWRARRNAEIDDQAEIDLEIQFDYNSADIRKSSVPSSGTGQGALGCKPEGLTFVIAVYRRDRNDAYNQTSRNAAITIKR